MVIWERKENQKKKKEELPNKPGGRFEGQKAIKEEKEKEDKSDNSVSSKSSHSSNSQEKEKKEKKEEKKPTEFKKPELKKPELKKVEVKKEEKKQEFKMPQLKKVEVKKPEAKKPEVKKEEKKVEEKKPNLIMNKNPQVPDQKVVKKILVNNQQSDIKFVKKTDNEKKVKINVKAEDNTKDDILKIRSQLKKGSGNKSTTDIGKKTTSNEPQKVSAFPGPFGGGGIKNLKAMFEANIKKQKSMGNIKGDPKAKK